jgi:hypothetical protein
LRRSPAWGVRLRDVGHEVAIAAYEPFGELVRGSGLEFRSLPGDPRQVAASDDNQRWQRGGGRVRGAARLVRLLAQRLPEINDGLLAAARQSTDVLLQLSMLGGYSIADGLGIPSIGVFVVPIHPTGDFPPPLGLPSLGRWGNRAVGRLLLGAGFAPFAASIRARRERWRRPTTPRTRLSRSRPPTRSPRPTAPNGPRRSPRSPTTSTCCWRSTTTPAEHWTHLRTANPIEATFATVRLQQRVTKGPGSRAAGVAMAFKLIESAQARAVNVAHLVALTLAGARFENGKLVEPPDESGGEAQVA